jgi:hypothetical protein
MEPDKVARVTYDPENDVSTSFRIEGDTVTDIDAEIIDLSPDESYIIGLETTRDEDGNKLQRYLKLPRKIMESRPAVVEFYDKYDTLLQGFGAVAVVVGVVAARSLFVGRLNSKKVRH